MGIDGPARPRDFYISYPRRTIGISGAALIHLQDLPVLYVDRGIGFAYFCCALSPAHQRMSTVSCVIGATILRRPPVTIGIATVLRFLENRRLTAVLYFSLRGNLVAQSVGLLRGCGSHLAAAAAVAAKSMPASETSAPFSLIVRVA
jgi:hypothetical protein